MTDSTNSTSYSVIIPCFNEHESISATVEAIARRIDHQHAEIIVVDDGSTDGTADRLSETEDRHPNVLVLSHESNRGYGAALKTGIRQAKYELIVITDADGTYPNDRIPELVGAAQHYDMVVGSRTSEDVTYSLIRKIPKAFLVTYASWLVKRPIPDLNSGMRVMRKSAVERFLHVLPDTFSFTTTITIAMLCNNYRVKYIPISYAKRVGQSKIKPIRDTLRFIQLIVRTGTYFAPLRVFLPVGLVMGCAFLVSLIYDLCVLRNLTDKTVLLMLFSMNTAMFALLADMIDKRSPR